MAEEFIERKPCNSCGMNGPFSDSKVCPACGQEGYFATKAPAPTPGRYPVDTMKLGDQGWDTTKFQSGVSCTYCMGSGKGIRGSPESCPACGGTGKIPAQLISERRNLSIPEPPPQDSSSPAMWDLVIQDMKDRDNFGFQKYKKRLQANNGRNPLKDAYDEVLDLAVYLRQAIYEKDGK